jgi:hypothetical protein
MARRDEQRAIGDYSNPRNPSNKGVCVGCCVLELHMRESKNAVVHGGKILLSNLPFPDGKHVRVIVEETDQLVAQKIPIKQVRELLKGGVERFDNPFEPMISGEDWETHE